MNKLKPAVSHSNLKWAPRWSFTGQIISNVLSHSRTGFIWLQNTPYIQIISKSQVTFPPPCSPEFHQLSVSFWISAHPVTEKILKWSLSFYAHLPKIFTLPFRPGGRKQNQRVLPQARGGRRCQDPFESRTTLPQASLSFPLVTEKLRQHKEKLPFVLVSGPGRTFPSDLFSFLPFSLLSPGMGRRGTAMGRTEQPLLRTVTPAPSSTQLKQEGTEPRLPQPVIFCWGGSQVPPSVPATDQCQVPLLMELPPLPGQRPCRVVWISSIWLVLDSRFLFVLSLFLVGCCLGEEGLL